MLLGRVTFCLLSQSANRPRFVANGGIFEQQVVDQGASPREAPVHGVLAGLGCCKEWLWRPRLLDGHLTNLISTDSLTVNLENDEPFREAQEKTSNLLMALTLFIHLVICAR